MENKVRQIIREEVYRVMQEIGEEDPMMLGKSMVDQATETVKTLELDLKFREADVRVSNLPRQEKEARAETAKVTKEKLEMAKKNLEMAKQSEINAVKFNQMQQSSMVDQGGEQSQVQVQT